MKRYHIYGMGNALLDEEYRVSDEQLLAMGVDKGHMTLVDLNRQRELQEKLGKTQVRACGGSVANSLIAASQLGAATFYSCRVASDSEGIFYLNDLKGHGVDSEKKPGDGGEEATGRCLLMITPDGERSMNTYLGASERYSVAQVIPQALSTSEYLYIEGYLVASPPSQQAILRSRELARVHGVKIVLTFSDVNMVSHFPQQMREALGEGVDILFANEEELLEFTGERDLGRAFQAMSHLAKTMAITRGPQGAVIFREGEVIEVSGYQVTAVDTNGAGDMFAGAFLAQLTQGQRDLAKVADFACRCAAQVVQKWGPRLSDREMEEVGKS